MWVLAPALWRHIGQRALENFQEALLNSLAGHVARDRRIVAGFARDLVDLVDIDDAALGAGGIAVCGLYQAQQHIFDIFADVAGLGQRGCIGNRKRHVQNSGERLRQQRLAATSRADEKDIGLLQLDAVVFAGVDAFVMVIDGNR